MSADNPFTELVTSNYDVNL